MLHLLSNPVRRSAFVIQLFADWTAALSVGGKFSGFISSLAAISINFVIAENAVIKNKGCLIVKGSQ